MKKYIKIKNKNDPERAEVDQMSVEKYQNYKIVKSEKW